MVRLFLFLALFSMLGCRVNDVSTSEREYASGATLFVQYAAEYHALCYQAFNVATWQLHKIMEAGSPDNPAVVLDLDETVLDNSPYSAWQVQYDSAFTPGSWKRWTDRAEAGLVPGVLAFLKAADEMGVALYYVSNRAENERTATLLNLQRLGIPQAQNDNLLLKTTTSSKDPRREDIETMGYTIVMLVGDNLGDHSGLFDKQSTERRAFVADSLRSEFGARYIVLPNPVYGEWERALYDYNATLTPRERHQRRRALLRSFE